MLTSKLNSQLFELLLKALLINITNNTNIDNINIPIITI